MHTSSLCLSLVGVFLGGFTTTLRSDYKVKQVGEKFHNKIQIQQNSVHEPFLDRVPLKVFRSSLSSVHQ